MERVSKPLVSCATPVSPRRQIIREQDRRRAAVARSGRFPNRLSPVFGAEGLPTGMVCDERAITIISPSRISGHTVYQSTARVLGAADRSCTRDTPANPVAYLDARSPAHRRAVGIIGSAAGRGFGRNCALGQPINRCLRDIAIGVVRQRDRRSDADDTAQQDIQRDRIS